MRFGFAAPPVAGHLNPMIALAAHLKSRGHEAVFFNFLDTEPRFREVNMPFLSYGAERFPSGDLARRTSHLSRLSGAEAMQFTFQMLTDSCLASLEDGARVTREWQADALIIDTAQRGFDLVAMHLGVPYVHLSNALHLDYWGSTPLCFYDWPYEEGPAALARNRKGLEMLRQVTTPLTEIQREYARHAGLELDWDDLARMISKRAWLTQCPKELDFPSDHWPDYFHHVGPLHNGAARAPVEFPWERLSGEPLIYASMGTLQNGAEAVFRNIVDGAAGQDRQIVLSIGDQVEPEKIGVVAGNTVIVKRAPQIEVLKRASVCITHAGLNTVLESLAQGLPMLAVPVTNDQPGVAARIAYTKTGIVIPLKELSAARVRSAVDALMTDPTYRNNARRLQMAIQQTNSLELAADLIERAVHM